MKKKLLLLAFCALLNLDSSIAQETELKYQDWVYRREIKSVRLENTESKELIFPVIKLNSAETLSLQFDDLHAGTDDYYYTIIHCTADWQPSRLSTLDYLGGFTEDRVRDYENSFNTIIGYTHYSMTFPSETMKPLIGGNYLLKVYKNNDPDDLVLTRRFYVVNQQVGIMAEVKRINGKDRSTKQQVSFSVQHGALNISNAMAQVKTVITQNDRPDNAALSAKPSFIRNNELVYDDLDAGIFAGASEFRNFDTRSLRYFSARVKDIKVDKEKTDVYLYPDDNYSTTAYSTLTDLGGSYAINNQDGRQPETDGDYTRVHFALANTPKPIDGDYYLFGKLTDYQLKDDYKLAFNELTSQLETQQLFKQGYYDYAYVFVPKGAKLGQTGATEGDFYETDNNYTIYIYNHAPGKRYDDLIGVRRFSSRTMLVNR